MITNVLRKLFGSRNERVLKNIRKIVEQINQLEPTYEGLSDEQLAHKTDYLKDALVNGSTLSDILPEAFATVRETSKRVMGLRHYDVQLIGGMVLHEGKIAEMQTGEGKTLVATLPAYLNALTGKGVHIVTVNDYLARRDAQWMGPIYTFLGMSVGVIVSGLTPAERKKAYQSDIVYGTNNEFGFDYLRDNMAFNLDEKVQRELNFAIVDEVDSILIDEARTPLIISGQIDDDASVYSRINELVPLLTKQESDNEGNVPEASEIQGDYTVDEKARQVFLTEHGHEHIETLLVQKGLMKEGGSLYSAANIALLHHVNAALRAHSLFQRDVDYIVRDKQVVIIDEHTGRMMPGRRWSEGLHQAIEAKEGAEIQSESQTLASITFQNYFRLYDTLSGMTGTADTEAFEFQNIYGLEVVIIPPNRPNQRDDASDLVYMSQADKMKAIIEDIQHCQKEGRPVLVGTASIETSEFISKQLTQEKIKHSVLNAKHHAKEAEIIAQAGRPGTVTIATNMAGRGTDIVLGGNLDTELAALGEEATQAQKEKVKQDWHQRHRDIVEAGGLHIVGTERHESRRIDNQLRGRAGRQGDPGSSRFYLSLEDNLIRIFASERMTQWMQRFGFDEGEAIEHPWLTKAIENAQRKVEGRNFDIRKQLLDYDNVANDQRTVIYAQRNELMEAEDISETVLAIIEDVVTSVIGTHVPPQSFEDMWDIKGLEDQLENDFSLKLPIGQWLEKEDDLDESALKARILSAVKEHIQAKERLVGPELMRHFEKAVTLQTLDKQWREHLLAMDYLRQGIHLRGYAQRQPMQEYKREAFELFSRLLDSLKHEVVSILCKVQVKEPEDVDAVEQQRRQATEKAQMNYQHSDPSATGEASSSEQAQSNVKPFVRDGKKVGRNEPCPCGSNRKFKHCHGRIAS